MENGPLLPQVIEFLLGKANSLYLHLDLEKVNVHKYITPLDGIEILNPIYLLGLQGGGLTLLSRMLRRNKSVVYCSGNWKRWAGDDETHHMYHAELPGPLKGPHYVHSETFGTCDMVYASDRLFDRFHKTSGDVTNEEAETYKGLIRAILAKYGRNIESPRFLDKSQSYTLKITYLESVLRDEEPYFLLLLRNPYVWCKRAVLKDTTVSRLDWTYEEKLRIACEHYRNSVETSIKEAREVRHFDVFRLEDLVDRPRRTLRSICEFLRLDFGDHMLPSPEHRYHWGAIMDDKWYPLRDPNAKYLERISDLDVKIIGDQCGSIAEAFGYDEP